MSELVRLYALVHGKVQGVYYRSFAAHAAKSLSVKGYVRNISHTGDVEVIAEGERSKIEEMLQQLREGPPEAVVNSIDVTWSVYTGQFANFDVRY